MRILIALLLLASQSVASSYTFTQTGSNSVQLDPAPPGATAIRARITNANIDFGYGFENIDPILPATVEGTIIHSYSVKASGVELASDRAVSQSFLRDYAPWDGAIDYSGTSGWTYHEWKVKPNATAWGTLTFSTPPTTLTFQRRTLYDFTQHPQSGWNYLGTSSGVTVEWEWL